jgi:hypothetical protein
LIATTFAGCKTSGEVRPPLAVQIPNDCERLARDVGFPALTGTVDVKLLLARYRAALVLANKNLKATRECQAEMRVRYAAGG